MKLFCIYDKKSGAYQSIVAYPSPGALERDIALVVNDAHSRTLLYTNAADYDLYMIGEWDVKTGEISPAHQFIRCCADLKQVSVPEEVSDSE